MAGHILYLVGGAPRVDKSSLAQRLLAIDGIPWLPTDVLRTVLRRVLPELDAIDQVAPELVVASNPGCLLHMARGLSERGSSVGLVHLVEVLGRAYPPGRA